MSTRERAPAKAVETPDITLVDEGTIVLFVPGSLEAIVWLNMHVEPGSHWLGRALCCEHRYAPELAEALVEAGFDVG